MAVKPNYTGHRKDDVTLRDYWSIFKLMSVYPCTIMEMGVDAGGSLLLWNDVFAPDLIVGLDINMGHEGLKRLDEFPNIQIHCFDQTADVNERTGKLDALLGIIGKLDTIHQVDGCGFDLIIDDIHKIDGVMDSMYTLWPYLNPGGAYVVEDWNQDDVYAKAVTRQCLDKLDYWRNVKSVTIAYSLIGLVKSG